MSNKYYTVCGVVMIDRKLLLVRHTYGTAKDRILLPGGYVNEYEMPTAAIEREIMEETSVEAKVNSLMAVQFKPDQWCTVFLMDYVDGMPKSDGYENSEVLLLAPEDALKRDDLTNMSRVIIEKIINGMDTLNKSDYIAKSSDKDSYVIFGV